MKRILAIMLAAVMLIGSGVIVNAEEAKIAVSDSLQKTISDLEKGYLECYNTFSTDTTLCSSREINGTIENIYLLEIKVVLKADSVEQMDYYQGIKDLYAEVKKLDIYDELAQYIGKEQNLVFYVKEIYPIDNESEKEILFYNGVEYVSLEKLLPPGHEELRQRGQAAMEYIEDEVINMIAGISVQIGKIFAMVVEAVS